MNARFTSTPAISTFSSSSKPCSKLALDCICSAKSSPPFMGTILDIFISSAGSKLFFNFSDKYRSSCLPDPVNHFADATRSHLFCEPDLSTRAKRLKLPFSFEICNSKLRTFLIKAARSPLGDDPLPESSSGRPPVWPSLFFCTSLRVPIALLQTIQPDDCFSRAALAQIV